MRALQNVETRPWEIFYCWGLEITWCDRTGCGLPYRQMA